jgi:hypothetical protein
MEQLLKPKVTLVFGRICSGKGSYKKDSHRVVVSDIVRSIINTANRDALQNTMHLDNRIAETIIEAAKAHDNIIIDGIRQVTIVDRVLTTFPDAEMIWLEVPVEERKRRYEKRKDTKDVESFEVADNKPIELECQKIFDTFKDKLTIINNYGIN